MLLLRLPVGRGGVINSPDSVFFWVSKVGLPLMGDTAVHTAVWARVTTAFELNF